MMHRLSAIWCICFANMMLLVSLAMMRCFPLCARRHTSFAKRTSLGEANIICRRQTSFKKRTFVGRQKCVFCWQGQEDSNPRPTVLETGTLPAELYPCMTNVPIISHFILFCNTFFKKIVYYRISFTSISNWIDRILSFGYNIPEKQK